MTLSIAFKCAVHEHCLALVEKKLDVLQKAIDQTRESLKSEAKSTAGDKHETGRAMAQLEMEKLGIQHQQILRHKGLLHQLKPHQLQNEVLAGSLIQLNNETIYYVSVGLGNILVESRDVVLVSPASPLIQQLLRKKVGTRFVFNEKEYLLNQCV